MKKAVLSVMLAVGIIILSGCVVTEQNEEYERKQFLGKGAVTEIAASDISADYTIRVSSDTQEIIVEYSDSSREPWYDISVAGGILKIEKTKATVGVEDNSVIITLPEREYQSISVQTSNGGINFENVLCEKYKCSVKNGDITGTLRGSAEDYLIVVNVKNGDSSLKNNVIESSEIVEFSAENGDVRVGFSK